MVDEALLKKIYDCNTVKFSNHVMTNGKTLPVYIDLRQTFANPEVYEAIAEAIWDRVKKIDFDYICGAPYGAIPFATAISLKHQKPLLILRKENKNHGTKKLVDGNIVAGKKVLLVDDFISSGNTAMYCMDVLTANGLVISDIAVFIDSILGGSALMKQQNINVHYVLTLAEFYQKLAGVVNFNNFQRNKIISLALQYDNY